MLAAQESRQGGAGQADRRLLLARCARGLAGVLVGFGWVEAGGEFGHVDGLQAAQVNVEAVEVEAGGERGEFGGVNHCGSLLEGQAHELLGPWGAGVFRFWSLIVFKCNRVAINNNHAGPENFVTPGIEQPVCAGLAMGTRNARAGPPARKGHGRDKQGTKQGHKGHKRKGRTGHPPYRGCPCPPECSRLSLRQGEAGSFLTPCHWRINPLAHAGLDFAGGL